MKCNGSLGRLGAALLMLIALTLVLASGVCAQSKYKTLYKFTGGKDGWQSLSGLIFDKAGNLYGTTISGGAHKCSGYGCGVVFKLTPKTDGSWTESVLHSFAGGNDGSNPYAGLIFDQAGNLYGTTIFGGANNLGTVFKLTPKTDGSWTESVLYSFTGSNDGNHPVSLIFDQAGNLYGTTEFGGSQLCYGNGCGVVFKLTPKTDGSWTESVLYSFTGGKDGAFPYAGVIFDTVGNLYGTTAYGGSGNLNNVCDGCGIAFKLVPNADGSWTESVLHNFCSFTNCSDGANPVAGLVFDGAGNLYGTSYFGGRVGLCIASGCGVVFRLTPKADGSWKDRVLISFRGKNGTWPVDDLIFDAAGNLYGTTAAGGTLSYCTGSGYPGGCGVVFKLAPNSKGGWSEIVLHNFVDHPGAFPNGNVILDAAGNLYGTTAGDLTTTFGSVFEITP